MESTLETIEQTQQQIIEEFSRFTDWEERYRKIIETGKALPDLPEELKIEKNRVRGCQSNVWLVPELKERRIHFAATSDAHIVRGLVALILRLYSGRTPQEILATPPDFIQRIGLTDNLSQGRANGLAAMVEQIKLYAQAYANILKLNA
jgi:cysteine desulfuration protein SufE